MVKTEETQEAPNLDEEVRRLREEQERQSALIDKALEGNKRAEGRTEPTMDEKLTRALEAGFRCFVSPAYKNANFLVHPGKVEKVQADVGGGRTRIVDERVGDIWAVFIDGYCLTDDPTVIKWCEKNHDKCRDVMDPQTEAWAALKEGQLNTSTKEPSIPGNLDVEAVLRGEVSKLGGKDSLVSRALSVLSGRG